MSSIELDLNVVGIANDNTGTAMYEASWSTIPLGTTWKKYAIPIPDPEKLTREAGLFWYADAAKSSLGHRVWFDDIKYETISTISNPRPFP